ARARDGARLPRLDRRRARARRDAALFALPDRAAATRGGRRARPGPRGRSPGERSMKTFLAALLLSALFLAGPALAEDEPAGSEETVTAAEERSAAFRAVKGAETENVPGGALLVGAYLALWALVLGYVLRLGKLTRGVQADVASLREALKSVD